LPFFFGNRIRFTIDGHFKCRNSSGRSLPIIGARVEFWHNYVGGTIDFDTTQVASPVYTDDQGFYRSANIHGDDVTNYYAKLVLNDDVAGGGTGVRLHQFYTQGSEYYLSPLADDSKGDAHFDRILNDDLGTSAPECAIWQNAHEAYKIYRDKVGGFPPSPDYDISIEIASGKPWTTLSTTHWPFNTQPDFTQSKHEFAHSIRHTLDGDDAEFYQDVMRFAYARLNHDGCYEMNHGFAFNEGWAEYWADSWWPAPYCNKEIYNHENTEREGVVAMALSQLSNCAGVGQAGMVSILRINPGTIHSLQEFYSAFQRTFPALNAGMFKGCSSVTPTVSPGIADEGDIVVMSAEETVQTLLSRRQRTVRKALRDAQIGARRAQACAEEACLSQSFDDVVKLFALQSELERTKLLRGLLDRVAKQRGSKRARFDRSADSPAPAVEFDRRNADIVSGFADRAIQSTKTIVERDHSGTLARKARELSAGIAQMKTSQQRGVAKADLPHISLAEDKAYPLRDVPTPVK
jgi:hypothetical protein